MDKIRHGLDLSNYEADKVFDELEKELGITEDEINEEEAD